MSNITLPTIILILGSGIFWGSAMSHGQSLTVDSELMAAQKVQIAEHWQNGEFSSFTGKDNVRINYASFTNDSHRKSIILVPGRTEGYLKYKELNFELFNQGYDIHIIDHRGQGISGRMTQEPHKGYVKHFDDYTEDLQQFVTIVSQKPNQKKYLLAHSMGGAIAARYLQRYQDHNISAAMLASPMIAVNSGGIPLWLAQGLINSGDALNNLVSDEPWYFLGQGNYAATAFEQNQLTHSQIRYQIFSELYQQTPELQLGGVTFHWLRQAIKANHDIFADIDKLTTPTMVLQAGADTVVDNSAQDSFCQALHQTYSYSCSNGKPIRIEGAYHELFFELDQYRTPAIEHVLEWFDSH